MTHKNVAPAADGGLLSRALRLDWPPMPAEDNFSLRQDGRVLRLFAARARERGGSTSDAADGAYPVGGDHRVVDPAAASMPRGHRVETASAIAPRLDAAFEARLREPLSGIATLATVLKHELDDDHAEQIDAMVQSAKRADGMLNDLLNFIRSGVSGIPIVRRRVDLKLLCERVVDAIHSAHPDHPVVFSYDSRLEGEFDPDAIATVLSKLVLNAMHHGAPRPAIRVELRGLTNEVVIDVWNAGRPLDSDLIGRLFEPFVCGRSARSDRAEGLGLGLYLARETVCAHGGRIELQGSDADGTTFRVTLPRR
jgi:signal transduction histidine kinase